MIHGPMLSAETLPSLLSTFSQALRISTTNPTAIPDQSALVTSTRGCGRNGRGHGQSSTDGREARRCDQCGHTNHPPDCY